MAELIRQFAAWGLAYVPSVANFVLVEVGDGARVFAALQRRGVVVRPVGPYGLPGWVRITVGDEAQNQRVLAALKEELKLGDGA